jgi:hypothetical protein
VGARYHGLLSLLLLGAKEDVTVGHFTGSLAAEGRAAPSVWHPGVSSSILLLSFWGSAKNSTVWTLPKKSFREQERTEVKPLNFYSLYKSF